MHADVIRGLLRQLPDLSVMANLEEELPKLGFDLLCEEIRRARDDGIDVGPLADLAWPMSPAAVERLFPIIILIDESIVREPYAKLSPMDGIAERVREVGAKFLQSKGSEYLRLEFAMTVLLSEYMGLIAMGQAMSGAWNTAQRILDAAETGLVGPHTRSAQMLLRAQSGHPYSEDVLLQAVLHIVDAGQADHLSDTGAAPLARLVELARALQRSESPIAPAEMVAAARQLANKLPPAP
jgi:hypothetical protein